MWTTLTGPTYSRGRHSDEDLVAGDLVRLGGGALLGDTTFLALEDGEGRHVECDGSIDADFRSKLCRELDSRERKKMS